MRPFVAAYITTDGEEWDQPLCVENTALKCKEIFADWYQSVRYQDIRVRYALVKVIEVEDDKWDTTGPITG
jgi:hypothetical protein